MLCAPGFSGAQISSTEYSDKAQVEAAAISPASNANLPMQQCLHSTASGPGIASGFIRVPLRIDCFTPARAEALLTLDGDDRVLIQQCLRHSGFDPGATDGLFDHQTRQALRQWQARHEYPQTGYVANSWQRAMLIDCLTPARMVQTAQTEWADAPGQWLDRSAQSIATQNFNGWSLLMYTGIGLVSMALLFVATIFGDGSSINPVDIPPAPPPPHPVFISSKPYLLKVVEGTTGNLGVPVTATNPRMYTRYGITYTNGPNSYSLSGTDAVAFSIDSHTGQLSLATGATLDYETRPSYRFSVIATNQIGLTASRAVSVTVVPGLQWDWETLKFFYNATDGPNWSSRTGWAAGVAATQAPTATELNGWHGVTVTDNRVTGLSLAGNNLTGNLPTVLGKLTKLADLSLDRNRLTGAVPEELTDINTLTQFQIHDQTVSAGQTALCIQQTIAFDTWLSGITATNAPHCERTLQDDWEALKALYYATDGPNWSSRTGWKSGVAADRAPTAAELSSWYGVTISTDHRVVGLELYNNNLTGNIPTELGNLTKLTRLNLARNQLTGTIPAALGKLTNLTTLYLWDNQLAGTVPAALGKLTNLKALWIPDNQLTGTVPEELTNLSLTSFAIHDQTVPAERIALCVPQATAFTTWLDGITDRYAPRCVGSLREDWKALKALYKATGGSNWTAKTGWVTGVAATQMPTAAALNGWHGVTVSSDGRVTELSLHANGLNSNIPPELGNLTELTTLVLSANSLTGAIPLELGKLTNLAHLSLQGNQLTGTVPAALDNLSKLKELAIHDNKLTGEVPEALTNLSLTSFEIHDQTVTSEQTALCVRQLIAFDTWLNGITTTNAPRCERTLREDWEALKALYHATNGPNWYKTKTTDPLRAYGNLRWATGVAADQVPTATELNRWPGVTVTNGRVTRLELYNNNLTGTIPPELGNLINLTTLFLSGNRLTGNIPTELGNLSKLEGLSLGDNQLAGNIPTELGKLTELTYLRLDSNQLTGSIPPELGNLTNLITLSLDSNQLTGNIPAELDSLSKLESLQMDGNRLTGEVPEELTNINTLTHFFIRSQLGPAEISAIIGGFYDSDIHYSGLCVPHNTAFTTWLDGIANVNAPRCAAETGSGLAAALSPPPRVQSIAFDSVPQQADTYGAGEIVRVVVQFDRLIASIDRMKLLLDIGDTRVAAVPVPTTGPTDRLRFQYDVAPGDRDIDGISIAADALRLNIAADVSRQGDLQLADLGDLEILNDPDQKVDAAERAVLKAALAAQGRAHLASATDVIEQRFNAGRAADINWVQLTQSLGSMAEDEHWRNAPWQSRLSRLLGNNFALALDDNSDQSSDASARGLTLWGALDNRNFAGSPDQGNFDGSMQTWYFGLDGTLGEQARWLAGVAVGTSSADTDYSFSGTDPAGTSGSGKLHTDLTGFYPYLHGRIGTGLEIWGLFGLGSGDAELTSSSVQGTENADLSLQLGSLGLKQRVLSQQRLKLSIRASIGYAQLETQAPSGLLQSLSSDVDRTQIGLEGEHLLGTWQPFWQVDSRRDGGDGLTGSGLELGGGVRFESGRLKGSIEAHYLAAHSASSLEESSLSATLQLKPRSSGQGLSASLTPSWGDTNSAGIQHAWQQSALTLIPTPSDPSIPWSLQSRLGYGLALPHSPAILTPFMELNQDDHHTRQRLGLSLQFGSSSTLAIEMGIRRDQTLLHPPDTAAELKLQLQY